jgi:hypothetical protein
METLLYVVVRFSSLELQELSVTRHRALSNSEIFIPAFEAFVHRAFSSFDLKLIVLLAGWLTMCSMANGPTFHMLSHHNFDKSGRSRNAIFGKVGLSRGLLLTGRSNSSGQLSEWVSPAARSLARWS